jgi:nitronate monooxygenase
LGIDVPIVQAPIGRVSGPALAAAVANAGGLGMLGVSFFDPDGIRSHLQEVRALADGPVGVDLLLEWGQRERLAACLEAGARIVSFFWADLAPGIRTSKPRTTAVRW